MARDYKSEYKNFHGRPEEIKKRAKRNKARAEMEKKGPIPAGVDVDHRVPMAKGGGNGKGNLRLKPKSQNRSFPRTASAKMK